MADTAEKDALENVEKAIRAVLNTSQHRMTIPDISKDYKSLMYEGIPFSKYGYKSLEEFLRSFPSLVFEKVNGQTTVRAALKKETRHIVQMVAAQKKPKKSHATSNRPTLASRPAIYQRASTSSAAVQRPANHTQYRMPNIKLEKLSSENKREAPQQRPKLLKIDPTIYSNLAGAIPKSSVNSRIVRNNTRPTAQEQSLNDRLVRQSSITTPPLSPSPSPPILVTISNGVTSPKPKIMSPMKMESDFPMPVTPEPEKVELDRNTTVPVKNLAAYCKFMGYAEPHYSYSCIKFKAGDKLFQCRVTICNKTYCSYPEHCESTANAQNVAAAAAIHRLILQDEIRKFPICQEDDVSIAERFIDILNEHPRGLLMTALPDYFRKKYGMTLSGNWPNILYNFDEFFSVEEIGGRNIVYSMSVSERPSSDLMNELDVTVFETLQLPWSQDMWKIQITNPVSTNEIYGQIVGEQYNKRLNTLMVDIEMTMMNKMPPVLHIDDIQVGRIYLVINNTNWSRVRVESIDRNNARFQCFCIDTGEQEMYTELYECSADYLKVPHQAICFSLAFLESFEGNPYVTQHLNTILAHKQFYARIMTKNEEFEMNSVPGEDVPIKVVLMDPVNPSLENNVNQQILQKICNETPAQELERSALNLVKITHVSDTGDIYCQLKQIGMNYIQRQTDALVMDESKMDLRRPMESESSDIRYLIHDRDSDKWYRAVPDMQVSLMETSHKMYCIDYGFILEIPDEDIYQLEPLSQALSKFPALAIKCRLYQLQNMTESIVARIKGLLSEGSECILKVMVSTTSIPQVNCYMRYQDQSFFCINESIKIEEEFGRQNDSKVSSSRNSPNSLSNSPENDRFSRLKITQKAQPKLSRTLSGLKPIEDFELPAIETTFTLSIVMISSPSNFIIQPHDDKINESFADLTSKLQHYCSGNNEQPIPAGSFEIGQAYAVFAEKDSRWYRGIVDLVINSQQVQVTLCDYGEKLLVSCNNIKSLPNDFRQLPKLGIRCCLHGIKPTHGDWTTDDILRFRGLVSSPKKKFFSIIKKVSKSQEDGGKIVGITLLDTSIEKDSIFNNLFVKEQRALQI
ncbi:uncharacterized protein LOC132258169 [Phlebotomus argentipes]|uniref:uncharacterized protein LOC132258169 n=1 Tax=Phlebotomus argentipes TaxID=94469 RepID=UPI002892CB67|nr:uncharacterized protein LOC132258169 [Phlebotomus argentipes]